MKNFIIYISFLYAGIYLSRSYDMVNLFLGAVLFCIIVALIFQEKTHRKKVLKLEKDILKYNSKIYSTYKKTKTNSSNKPEGKILPFIRKEG